LILTKKVKNLQKGTKNMFEKYPDVVNVSQLQEMLGVGRNTAYKLLSTQIIKAKKIGRVYLIPKANIVQFLETI